MSKAVVTREEEMKEIEKIRPNKADLFVDAYIRNRFNGTAAAMEVFDIEGDDEKAKRNCAGSIAYIYLQKDDVQAKLRERMKRADVSVEYVITRIKAIAEEGDSTDDKLRALDRLAHFVGAEIKERSTDVSKGRNAQLNLYMDLPHTERPKGIVIDVESAGK